MFILFVYTLIKVVSYYDLSVLSMSVMGFQKKSSDGGWVGGVSSIKFYFDLWNFVNFAKTLSARQSLITLYIISNCYSQILVILLTVFCQIYIKSVQYIEHMYRFPCRIHLESSSFMDKTAR